MAKMAGPVLLAAAPRFQRCAASLPMGLPAAGTTAGLGVDGGMAAVDMVQASGIGYKFEYRQSHASRRRAQWISAVRLLSAAACAACAFRNDVQG